MIAPGGGNESDGCHLFQLTPVSRLALGPRLSSLRSTVEGAGFERPHLVAMISGQGIQAMGKNRIRTENVRRESRMQHILIGNNRINDQQSSRRFR